MAMVISKSLTLHGFIFEHGDVQKKALETFVEEMTKYLVEGKVTNLENRYQGLKLADQALLDIVVGKSVGKPIIVASDE